MSNPPDETRDPWTILSERSVYQNPWIEVVHRDVLNPKGAPGIYGIVRFKKLAVGVIPIDAEGNVYLVGQWRVPLKAYSWEAPTGGAEPGEDPAVSARRELKEETGLDCAELTPIVRMDLSNSCTDEKAVVFLGAGLTPGQAAPEDTEELAHKKMPFHEALAAVIAGQITDSLTVAGMLRAHHMAVTGGVEPVLAARMLGRQRET